MKNEWVRIPPSDAEKHELYGIGGWLWLFSIAIILGLLVNLDTIRGVAFQFDLPLSEFLSIDEPIISFFKFSTGAQIVMSVTIFGMMIVKASGFRRVTIGLLIGITPIVLLVGAANPFVGFGQIAAQSLVPWLISCAVWCTYLHRSRRVRVTFEHLVRNSNSVTESDSLSDSGNKSININAPSSKKINFENSIALGEENLAFAEKMPEDAVDEHFWAEALKEVDGIERRPGLWARSFAQAKGDETQAKVIYLEVRARELAEAHQAVLREQEHLNRMKEQEERLAALTEEEKAYELLPKGVCPNCSTVQPLDSEECPSCKAIFDNSSAWKLTPLPVNYL